MWNREKIVMVNIVVDIVERIKRGWKRCWFERYKNVVVSFRFFVCFRGLK